MALTEKEKRGFEVFTGRGRCIACHSGSHLANNTFFTSVGVPELSPASMFRDLGRFEVTKDPTTKLFFKVPSLRNISTSAPYFHNGAMPTLRSVVEHYNNAFKSIDEYTIPKHYEQTSVVPLRLHNNAVQVENLKKSIQAPFLRHGLGLTESVS